MTLEERQNEMAERWEKKTKVCPWHNGGLGEILDRSEFNHSDSHSDGLQYACRECKKMRSRRDYDKESGPSIKDQYNQTKNSAIKRGLSFEISLIDYARIVRRDCVYNTSGIVKPEIRRGIDRKDNAIGYTLENCVPCCWYHNEMKRHRLSYDDMLFLVNGRSHLGECKQMNIGRKKLPR
jgi:hypothetical protein